MSAPIRGTLLRIFIGESDHHEGRPLYQWIVARAQADRLAGATVLRGLEGFGSGGRVHHAGLLRLSEDLPLVVEIVDEEGRIRAFLDGLASEIDAGLFTLETVELFRFPRRDA